VFFFFRLRASQVMMAAPEGDSCFAMSIQPVALFAFLPCDYFFDTLLSR